MSWLPDLERTLPVDDEAAVLVGRVWDPTAGGPTPVLLCGGELLSLSASYPTVSALLEEPDPVSAARKAAGESTGAFADIYYNTQFDARDDSRPWLLAPHDLQAVKAAGVTFAVSMIERVIDERARGDYTAAAQIRARIADQVGGDLRDVRPGSPRAAELKEFLIAQGLWSQYLEVGIGPDAEIFTKSPPLASRGTGERIGVLRGSSWNNPEPEVALAVSSRGRAVGALLANDVNLRDIEGRSALLLPRAKDNNASCATGPLIRLFDERFGVEHVRAAIVSLSVLGRDGFSLTATSDMRQISRDPLDLVAQLIGNHHQYPDGAVLMMGTLFAPTDDRDSPGMGFTHKVGDRVEIQSPLLGTLVNIVDFSEDCEPWTFGVNALMSNLARRGLLASTHPNDL